MAQTYLLNSSLNGQTISTCSGMFHDSGGPYGPYGFNEDYTVTFSPSSPDRLLQFTFSRRAFEQFDYLLVYDGNSVNNKLLPLDFTWISGGNASTAYIVNASDTNSTGSLTFSFHSDGTRTGLSGDPNLIGWSASISCLPACRQSIQGSISTFQAQGNCLLQNDTVRFNASTSYPQSGYIYPQADASSDFHWYFGDGRDTVGKGLTAVSHIYAHTGNHTAYIIISDANQCINQQPISTSVTVKARPHYGINLPQACSGDTLLLQPANGLVEPQLIPAAMPQLPVAQVGSLLPYNGTGVLCQSRILVDHFASGQKLNDINDLLGIMLNIEHQRGFNLSVTLTAPNNTKVHLIGTQPFQGLTHLGEPVLGLGNNPSMPGNGYNYVFRNISQYGTMGAESMVNRLHSYKDNSGFMVTNGRYLPTGSYATESPLQDLVGTPLNGVWTLTVYDHYALYSGTLFYWKLDFAASIFPALPAAQTIPIASQQWVPAIGLIGTNGTVASIVAQQGSANYTYRVTDANGCIFDTAITVTGKDTTGLYNALLLNNVEYCASSNNVLRPTINSSLHNFLWNNGSTADTLPINQPGNYWVTAQTANGCTARASAIVTDNPINSMAMPADTTLCGGGSYVEALSVPNGSTVLWNNGNTTANQLVTAPSTHGATVMRNGCSRAFSFSAIAKPLPVINLGADETACMGTPIIKTIHYPNASYLWSTGSTDSAVSIRQLGLYWAEARLDGCSYRDSIKVSYTVCDCQTIVPNAFSPNGDGVNDGFKPQMQCSASNLLNYNLSIFNRNGQQVFSSNSTTTEWNGLYKGKPAPVGTYYYIISYHNPMLLKSERYTGSITLLR